MEDGKQILKSFVLGFAEEDLDTQKLALSHMLFVKKEDSDGFSWCVKLFQGLQHILSIGLQHRLSTGVQHILSTVDDFRNASYAGQESPEALDEFHMALQATKMCFFQTAEESFQICYLTCTTEIVKYEAANELGSMFWEQHQFDSALKWFAIAKTIASSRQDVLASSLVIATYNVGRTEAALKQFPLAQCAVDELNQRNTSFSLALASMLDADIKYFQGVDLRAIILAYSKSRKLLLRTSMPNLMSELSRFLSLDNSADLVIEILMTNFDTFTYRGLHKYLSVAIKDEEFQFQSQPISFSFFAYVLYFYSRKRILQLQTETCAVEDFMDPRPHYEQSFENSWDIKSHILCQQISLKAGDMTSFQMGMFFLMVWTVLKEQADEVFRKVVAIFENFDGLEEDPKAWAAYILGVSNWFHFLYFCKKDAVEEVPDWQIEKLNMSLRLAKTPFLKSLVAYALFNHKMEISLLEDAKEHALASGNVDLIMLSFYRIFEAVDGKHDRRQEIYAQLRNVASGSPCMEALTKYMEGMVHFCFDPSGSLSILYTFCKMAEALPMYPYVTSFYRHLAGDENKISSIQSFCLSTALNHARTIIQTAPPESFPYRLNRNAMEFAHERELVPLFQHSGDVAAAKKVSNKQLIRDHFGQLKEQVLKLEDQTKLLVVEGELEEAEEKAVSLLQHLQLLEDLDDQLPEVQSFLLIQKFFVFRQVADLVCEYYKRSEHKEKTMSTAIQLTNHFHELLIPVARNDTTFHSDIYSSHALALWKLGRTDLALDKLHESLRVLMQADDKFGTFSEGRIPFNNEFKLMFGMAQLFQTEHFRGPRNFEQALVWSERERARDFLYRLKDYSDRQSYLKELREFDSNDEKALEEIRGLTELVGKETVILVITQTRIGDTWQCLIYFMHASRPLEVVHRVREEWPSMDDIKMCVDDNRFINWFSNWYCLLVFPFREHLEDIKPKKIIFVPSEDLCTFPFGLLMDIKEDKFLIQKYAVATVSSLRLLKYCELRRMELEAANQVGSSLVVGNPTKDLKNAFKEANTVADVLERSKRAVKNIKEEGATKQTILHHLASSDWVHIACHGIVNEEYPDGALLLAQSDVASSSASSSNILDLDRNIARTIRQAPASGKLHGDEIVEHLKKDRMKASAVVLSACTSGVGRIFSEGILALPRSFHMCGVPSVVVSLWNVNDGSTCKLMEKLYAKLYDDGLEIAEALQVTMREMLEDEDEYGHCRYTVKQFAPFIVSGSCSTTLRKKQC